MTNTVSRLRSEEGFTLIELMIVVVVLGILAGLVLLGVTGFSTQAEKAKVSTDADTCKTVDAAIAAAAANGETKSASDFLDADSSCTTTTTAAP